MRATGPIFAAAGSPAMPCTARGLCRTCGAESDGLPFGKWVKPTFTDQDKLLPGATVCAACLFCFDDSRVDLASMLGKDKPQKMRNYSHFVSGGVWHPLSKGAKAEMGRLLLSGPEVAVIAVSGQKHLAFRCPVGWWQIEDATVAPFPKELGRILGTVEELYNADISKTEIETGRYIQRRILDAGVPFWSERESVIAPLRGSIKLQLALFLAQRKDEDGESEDSRQPAVATMAGDVERIQDKVCPVNLEPIRGQPAQRSLYEQLE